MIESNKKFTINELKPAAVILAARLLQEGEDEYAAGMAVQKYFADHGHWIDPNAMQIHMIVLMAIELVERTE